MPKFKFDNTISWGHLAIIASFVMSAISMYYGIAADITSEARARELTDTTLSAQLQANAKAIEHNIEAIQQLESWRSSHQREWDKHLGEGR